MKRILIPGLMLAAAFALTNCTEQLVDPNQGNDSTVEETANTIIADGEGIPFDVFVDDAETKTLSGTKDGQWKTAWVKDDDKIILYSKPQTGSNFTRHNSFKYVGEQRFTGDIIGELSETNNWYSIYPYKAASSGTTINKEVITIGASTVTQSEGGSMAHLCGTKYPMYGIKNNVPKDQNVRFKMSHLYALVALEIVNEGDGGDIIIDRAEFGVPAITSGADKQIAEQIVGDFEVDITANELEYKPVASKTASKAEVKLKTPMVVQYGENNSQTLYLAVSPFNASGKTIEISINGSTRRVKMPANVKLEAGKMTKFRVPVKKLSFGPTVTNLLSLQTTTMKSSWGILSTTKGDATLFTNRVTEKMIINGKEIETHILGTESKVGSVTLRGTAKELFPYIPLGFYASSWNDKQAVMRVEKIKAYFWLIFYIPIEFSYTELIGMMSPDRIQFKGVLPLEQYVGDNGKKHLVILDEEPYHKQVAEAQIESMLQNFDDNPNDGKSITFNGLYDAITNPGSIKSGDYALEEATTPADITAHILYHKIFAVLHNSASLSKLEGVAELIFSTPKKLFETVATMPIEVTLSTVAKGSEGATDNRLIMWGLNSPNVK